MSKLAELPDPSARVSEHFFWAEAMCRCGRPDCPKLPLGGHAAIVRTAHFMEQVRRVCGGHRVKVHSWFRCPWWNRAVGGVANSVHLTGKAVDINILEVSPKKVQMILRPFWPEKPWPGFEDTDIEHLARLRGFGSYPGFTHVDCGGSRPRKWTQTTRNRVAGR